MNQKIALITDSTSDLSKDIISEYNIIILPFRIIYSNREYKDMIEISAEEVYKSFDKEIPTSSLPSMSDMDEIFSVLEKEGYTHIIVVTISSKLSGIYNALAVIKDNHKSINTYIIDSKSISMGEGLIAIACGEMIKKGMSFNEIINQVPNIKSKIHLYFVVETLEYLRKGGRIVKVTGIVAQLLDIKPIISVDAQGYYYTAEKVRGRKNSINRLIKLATSFIKNENSKIYIMHGNAPCESMNAAKKIKEQYKNIEVSFAGQISPVSGVHSGPGLIGIVCFE